MIISILAATSLGGIGNRGTLPWPHNKEDMRWFAQHTTGHIVVMGRNTWNDPKMPKPLPNRVNCVVTNRSLGEHGHLARRLSGNINDQIKLMAENFPTKDVYIIGGQTLYETTNDLVERVYLTRMKGNYWCDTRINLERYLNCFRIKTVRPGTDCTYEIWERVLF
jgi:dihydrofolate reductase